VLVPKPGYPLFDYLAGLEGIRALPYYMEYIHREDGSSASSGEHDGGWRIDLDRLEDTMRSSGAKAVVLIHPNNPTGSYVGDAERERIVSLCARYGAAIIADEVFLPYRVDASEPRPSFGGEERCLCFALDGMSKLLCLPQLKLGWLRVSGPDRLKREACARLEIIADTYLSVGAVPMRALPGLLGRADGFVETVRERLALNMEELRGVFGFQGSGRAAGQGAHGGSPYRVYRCEGGWTALLEVPRILPEEELALDLLKTTHTMVHPGYFFDCEREGILAVSLIVPPAVFASGTRAIRSRMDELLG
jgi:aspartate/methionine/tyrosine aminotransferase